MIRNADHKDIEVMLKIGQRTLERSPTYPVSIDKQKASYAIRRCMADRNMCAFVAEVNGDVVGFILGMQEEHFFSRDCYATDLVFCVNEDHPDQAVWLLRRFTRWAKTFPKVKSIMLGVSSGMDPDGRLGKMYKHHRIDEAGRIYIQILNEVSA